MSTLHALQDILIKDYRLRRDQLEPDAILTTLGLDSLSVLELMFKIEDHFDLKIVEDMPSGLVTVSDVVRFVDRLLGLKEASSAHSQAQLGA